MPAALATTVFSGWLLKRFIKLQRELALLDAELSRARKLRQDERAGRTTAERALRKLQQQRAGEGPPFGSQTVVPKSAKTTSSTATCAYRPIGHIESCFVERRGTPRQGMLVPTARARLRLNPHVVQPAAALEGLTGFSHVWLLFDFHENTNSGKAQQVRAKVHPPGLSGDKVGLFATRTPHRPNPIGLSVAQLLHVSGGTLLLGGADLIDGTPILDVKPYLLHDIQPAATVPSWCEKRTDASQIARVDFSAEADAQLATAVGQGNLRFYTDVGSARLAIAETLQLDIRSVHQGRGSTALADQGQPYACRFDTLSLDFTTYATHVLVTRCEAGGRAGRGPSGA